MKIGIDVSAIHKRKSGLGHYVDALVSQLPDESNGHEIIKLTPNEPKNFRTYERLLWENCTLPKKARQAKVDLLHVPAYAPPRCGFKRLAVTVHDLIGLLYPNQRGILSRHYWGKWLPAAVKSANVLIADSEHTKQDLMTHLSVPENKIRVIYASGHEGFRSAIDLTESDLVLQKWNIAGPYFLFVGTIEPRKNLQRVIEAFFQFQKSGGKEDYRLVVVGSKDFAHGEVFKELASQMQGNEQSVIFTDYVSHDELNALYSRAELFLMPSLYEGFGIPVLEAMGSGCPVLTSNTTSLPEVAGDAAILVDPLKTDEIVDGMKQVAGNETLRSDLRMKGVEQIKKFSWQKLAKETIQVYESMM